MTDYSSLFPRDWRRLCWPAQVAESLINSIHKATMGSTKARSTSRKADIDDTRASRVSKGFVKGLVDIAQTISPLKPSRMGKGPGKGVPSSGKMGDVCIRYSGFDSNVENKIVS